MPANFRVSSLIPSGLIVESLAEVDAADRSSRYPGGDVSSVWFAFAARSQPLCSEGLRSAVLRPGRMPSGRDTPVLLQDPHCRRQIFADERICRIRSQNAASCC